MLVIEKWFETALGLAPGEDLYIPVGNVQEGKAVQRALLLHKKKMMEIAPIESFPIKITIDNNIGERKVFVRLHREGLSPETAFIRSVSKELIKVEIDFGEKERIITLMKKDGYSEEEIDDYFNKEKEFPGAGKNN